MDSIYHFQVLEFCSGGSLLDFLNKRDPNVLNEGELRGVLKGLCNALAYLKHQSVVHRDISPSNILLTADYRPKLSNFFSATRMPHNSLVSGLYGDQEYMSPEMVRNLPYDCSTDIWSLGCVAVTCVTGAPPIMVRRILILFPPILL
ncbi:kinase-like protein [Fistulina hepatica ATCC 64428]|uniref:Kinase-like protein n=1 Tax=Fistulina hepatica ATCC 64428 TaxID=1128425 RepID=A0A0D7A9B5_9AGAR|nr:kinase-like protein [Fistulina hepatica ATCC 64428]